MKYYICMDGGQTKTEVFVVGQKKEIFTSWKEKAILHPAKMQGKERLKEIVNNVSSKWSELGISPQALHSVSFSLSGYHGEENTFRYIKQLFQEVFPELDYLYLVPDYVGNWHSVTQGKSGIVVISGGGSVVYGRNSKGDEKRLGGWGHTLGDVGSGYWIGLEAVKSLLEYFSKLRTQSILIQELITHFQVGYDLDLINQVYAEEIQDKDFAELVPIVNRAAGEGDFLAIEILETGAQHLSLLTIKMLDVLQEDYLPIYLSGGVFNSNYFRKFFVEYVREQKDFVVIYDSVIKPNEGILQIALEGDKKYLI